MHIRIRIRVHVHTYKHTCYLPIQIRLEGHILLHIHRSMHLRIRMYIDVQRNMDLLSHILTNIHIHISLQISMYIH